MSSHISTYARLPAREKLRNSLSAGGFLSACNLVAALLCAGVACLLVARTWPATGAKLALLGRETPIQASQRTLSFAERVSYQRAIEEVYWRHRIWPKENPDPKPSLDAVMSPAQMEKKVEDYLRNSEALEDYWQQPLSAEQLQAEMERMAQHTKQPEVLRELFEALGNDPFVIAECLARPALSERLLTNFYSHDQRFHGELRQRAEAELQTHHNVKQMKRTSGHYSEIELVRSDSDQDEENRGPENSLKMNSREWDENVQKLAAMFATANPSGGGFGDAKTGRARPQLARRGGGAPITQIKTGVLSPLQEDEGRYYAAAVLKKSKDRLKLATVEWRKEPLGSWRTRVENRMPKVMAAATANYTVPIISDGASGCANDTWTTTSAITEPPRRFFHTAVWTGSEMIVWGGDGDSGDYLNTGRRYNPSTDSWTPTSTTNAPSGRILHTAVWSGTEMIVWGGYAPSHSNTGGRYNPSTDSWLATSTSNTPSPRDSHTAVWTGSEMIVWGGQDSLANRLNTGGRYNPSTNSWTATSTTNAPAGREHHTAVWTGSEMIIWGGDNGNVPFNTGGRYNPSTNSWTATSTTNAPFARSSHTAVWAGSEMIVWGGFNGLDLNSGGRYNPGTDTWTATSTTNRPAGRDGHTAVWTGSEMIVWGGGSNTGGRYNPSTNSWLATSTTNAPSARSLNTAVWTGSEMIVWGGQVNSDPSNTGGRYNPTTDSWTATSVIANAPTGRFFHTAVWTGSEMIIWGGTLDQLELLNTGGRYNPSTDSWTATSTTNAPSARNGNTAIWSGSEMIVWGGGSNTGGRYNPSTNSWLATSTTNAPSARNGNTAVWTGSEMIVWGGRDNAFHVLNTGGKYNRSTDSWTATSTTNAPSARAEHTAVWSGSEMIVWGGLVFDNTGGRYCAPVLPAQLGNISTRAFVQTGDNVVIGGFIVQGAQPKRVIIRAIGPELSQYGVPNALFNPTLELHDGTGALIGSNDSWLHTIIGGIITSNQVREITDSGYAPGDPRESAIIADLAPGNYTAILRGVNNMTGVALVEVYDLSGDANSILGNISTRAFVQTGDNVMIGGFIVQGAGQKRVIVRAIGPELTQYGVPNALSDPTLELHDGTGALIASNNTWLHTIIGGIITANQVRDILDSGHAPSDPRESAIIAELPPDNYTAIVRGVNNTTGVALVEVYDLD